MEQLTKLTIDKLLFYIANVKNNYRLTKDNYRFYIVITGYLRHFISS